MNNNYALIYPKNLSFETDMPIHPQMHAALYWMDQIQPNAYKPGWVKAIKFGHLSRILKDGRKYIEFEVRYDNPYGLLRINSDIRTLTKISAGYYKQTYCTLGVAAGIYYYTHFAGKTYRQARGKHPIHMFCQSDANSCFDQLESGTKYKKWNFREIDLANAVNESSNGKFVIAVWKNEGGIGHVSMMLGWNPFKSCPYCYNIGSKNGYMSLSESFPKIPFDEIKYYILEE